MAVDLLGTALSFLETYGLWAVFILLVLDGAMLMPVLPGEVVMIMAVAEYADTLGDLAMLVGLTTLAGMIGSVLLYVFSRSGGRRMIEAHPRLFMMPRYRRERLERAFEHPVGQSLVMFLRVIPFTRILVNIPAGLARMKVGRFLVLSTIGMLVFHAGFLWMAFRYGDPGAGVGGQATQLQEAYANPAWEYMQANEVITALGLLAFGAIASFRASRRVLKYPDEAGGSLIGWFAARILFWGGIGLGTALWIDPGIVFEFAEAGGLDVQQVAAQVRWEPVSLAYLTAAVCAVLGGALILMNRAARRRSRRVKARREFEEEVKQRREEDPERRTGRPEDRVPDEDEEA